VESKLKVKILRKAKVSMYPFMDYFKGFEKLQTVKRIFGEKTEEVLRNLKVEFAGMRAYMGVSDKDGHLLISANYLNNGDITDLYLDVIHELVHVRQFIEGKQLFDSDFSYIERPTEVEAYTVAVQEARRLGLNDDRICEYLRTEWMSDEDFKKLAKAMNVDYSCFEKKESKR
jgi:predicted HAD superfamily Cof-like phosphohydrolase